MTGIETAISRFVAERVIRCATRMSCRAGGKLALYTAGKRQERSSSCEINRKKVSLRAHSTATGFFMKSPTKYNAFFAH